MRMWCIALAAAASFSAVPAQGATIISENFESGFGVFTPSGQVGIYNGTDYIGCCGTAGTPGAMANHFVSFGSGNEASGSIMTTAFNSVAGQLYHVSFDYGALGAGSETLSFSLPDFAVTFGLTAVANNNMDTTFQSAAWDITGTGGVMTIEFHSSGLPNVDAILDNFVITGPAPEVPEPATWAMMLLGFGAIGASLRRSAKKPLLA
jgi:hypothetical protein